VIVVIDGCLIGQAPSDDDLLEFFTEDGFKEGKVRPGFREDVNLVQVGIV